MSASAEEAKRTLKGQEEGSVQRIKEISMRIREAIRASLPTPQEQFFTVMVPGKVVTFEVRLPSLSPFPFPPLLTMIDRNLLL